MPFKPHSYTSVSPYLVVDDAAAEVEFLATVFGVEKLRFIPGDDGRLRHAEVRIDDTVVMLADAIDGWPAVPAHLHVYVPDVDATYTRALQAGATAVQAPVQTDDVDKRGGFLDANGVTWWIGQQIGCD